VVAAVVRLREAQEGTVVLRFTRPVAISLASALSGEEVKEVNSDCLDALGEIANIVVGSAKKLFPGAQVTIEPPHVLTPGTTPVAPELPGILLPFETACGRFILEAALVRRPCETAVIPPPIDFSAPAAA
jgi:chemotaxis protein CheX